VLSFSLALDILTYRLCKFPLSDAIKALSPFPEKWAMGGKKSKTDFERQELFSNPSVLMRITSFPFLRNHCKN